MDQTNSQDSFRANKTKSKHNESGDASLIAAFLRNR